MASSYSNSLRLELIGTGEQSGSWGDTTNRNLGTLLEQAIAGYTTVTIGNADATLTQVNGNTDQARAAVLNIASSVNLSATRNVVCPSVPKVYVVTNSTAGSQAIFFKTSLGNGVLIPNGAATLVYCNGTDVVSALNHTPLLNAPTLTTSALTASTSATTPLVKVPSATAPASPANGDIWHAVNRISARVDGTTQVVAQKPIALTARVATSFSGFKSLSITAADASVNLPGSYSTWFPAVPTYPGAATYNSTAMSPTAPVSGIYEITFSGVAFLSAGTGLVITTLYPEWLGNEYTPAKWLFVLDAGTNTNTRTFSQTFCISVPETNRGLTFGVGGPTSGFSIDVTVNIRWIAPL